MSAFIAAVSLLPLVTSAMENPNSEGRVIVNVNAGYWSGESTSQYDDATVATSKAIDLLAAEHGFKLDNADTDADGTEVWYFRATGE
jgi:hypothetical protein